MSQLRFIPGNAAVTPPQMTPERRLQRSILFLRTVETEQRHRLAFLTGDARATTLEVADRIGAAIAILQGMLRNEATS